MDRGQGCLLEGKLPVPPEPLLPDSAIDGAREADPMCPWLNDEPGRRTEASFAAELTGRAAGYRHLYPAEPSSSLVRVCGDADPLRRLVSGS